MPNVTAEEALQHHRNLIFRRCLEKLQAEQPLSEEELAEVNRRAAEEEKPKAKPTYSGGRPNKLNRKMIQKIRAYIAAGNTYKNACLMCRISEFTLSRWLNTAKETPIICELRQAVKEAHAEAEAKMVELVRKHAISTWQAAAWYLERRSPEAWSKRDTIRAEHSGPDGGPIKTDNVMVYIPDNGRAVS